EGYRSTHWREASAAAYLLSGDVDLKSTPGKRRLPFRRQAVQALRSTRCVEAIAHDRMAGELPFSIRCPGPREGSRATHQLPPSPCSRRSDRAFAVPAPEHCPAPPVPRGDINRAMSPQNEEVVMRPVLSLLLGGALAAFVSAAS